MERDEGWSDPKSVPGTHKQIRSPVTINVTARCGESTRIHLIDQVPIPSREEAAVGSSNLQDPRICHPPPGSSEQVGHAVSIHVAWGLDRPPEPIPRLGSVKRP